MYNNIYYRFFLNAYEQFRGLMNFGYLHACYPYNCPIAPPSGVRIRWSLNKTSPGPSVPAVVHRFSHVHSFCRSVFFHIIHPLLWLSSSASCSLKLSIQRYCQKWIVRRSWCTRMVGVQICIDESWCTSKAYWIETLLLATSAENIIKKL